MTEAKKMDMRFGTWNIRRAGSVITVAREISKYKSDLVGVQEVRWDRGGTDPRGITHFSMEMGMGIMN
jgi:hypothetical protein